MKTKKNTIKGVKDQNFKEFLLKKMTEQWMNDNHDLIWEETMCEGCNKGLWRYEKYGRNLCDKCESFII